MSQTFAHCAWLTPLVEGKRDLLEPAVEAVRRALRKMDADEVPARLRRVAGISARRLTTPHADRVLSELDASEWLRTKALERWDDVPQSVIGSRKAAEQFLRRPDGWEAVIEAETFDRIRTETLARIAALESENQALRERIEGLRSQIRRERKEARATLREAGRKADERTAREETGSEALKNQVRGLERELAASRTESANLAADLEEADARITLLLERGGRRDTVTGRAMAPAVFGRGAPQASARTLDHLAHTLEPPAPGFEPVAPPPLAFPENLRPDRPEAIEWLLERSEPALVLVDGYNVAHAIGASSDSQGRARVEAAVARLRRRADAPLTVRLFWDSAQGRETVRAGGVIVVFVESADDSIVAASLDATGLVMVISSDRDVRERSQATVAVWSEAFAGWL